MQDYLDGTHLFNLNGCFYVNSHVILLTHQRKISSHFKILDPVVVCTSIYNIQ